MKKSRNLLISAVSALTLVSCGSVQELTDRTQALDGGAYYINGAEQEQAEEGMYEEATFAELTSEQSELSFEEEEALRGSDEAQTIRSLRKYLRSQVAECAGIEEIVAPYRAQLEALREGDEQVSKDELKAVHKELREALRPYKEDIRTCRKETKDSEAWELMKSVREDCFERPEHDGKKKKAFRKGMKKRKGKAHSKRRGFKKGHRILPPLKFNDFGSEVCQATLDEVNSFLDTDESAEEAEEGTVEVEEDIAEVEEDQDTEETQEEDLETSEE